MVTQLEIVTAAGHALGALTGAAQTMGVAAAAETSQIAGLVRDALEMEHIDDLRLVDAVARLEVLEQKLLAYAKAHEVHP